MNFDEIHKNKVENDLVQIIISGLEQNKITEEVSSEVTDFILSKIDLIKSQDELIQFLEELSTKWPFFSSVLSQEKGVVLDKVEEKVANDVLKLTKEGKINEAVDLAKTLTKKQGE